MNSKIKTALLSEIYQAHRRGLVDTWSAIIDKENRNSTYDGSDVQISHFPSQTQIVNPTDEIKTDEKAETDIIVDFNEFPNFLMLHIRFTVKVQQTNIDRLSDYLIKKYQCRTSVYPGRLDVYGFSKN